MVERRYLVEGREVKLNIYVIQTNPPQVVFEVYADPETVKKYVDENGIAFAVNVDDIFDAIREVLSPSKIVRD
jgi:hypothetical protein